MYPSIDSSVNLDIFKTTVDLPRASSVRYPAPMGAQHPPRRPQQLARQHPPQLAHRQQQLRQQQRHKVPVCILIFTNLIIPSSSSLAKANTNQKFDQ